jgi:hypothetical protein
MSFVLFSKINTEGNFWEHDNITILGVYDSITNAITNQKELVKKYIHEQTESGYKLHEHPNNTILITKDIQEISYGYIYNSTYIKQESLLSFHIKKCGQIPITTPKVTLKINNQNSNETLLVNELKDKLKKGIILKKTNINLNN